MHSCDPFTRLPSKEHPVRKVEYKPSPSAPKIVQQSRSRSLCNTYLIYSRDLNKVFATPTHAVSYLWKHCAIFCPAKPDEIHATDCSIDVKLDCKIQSTMISQAKRREVNEMRMRLRWMCGVTKKDKIWNEHVRGSVKVAPVTKKITEGRLRWYGHCVKRRDEGDMLRRMVDAPVPGKRWRVWG